MLFSTLFENAAISIALFLQVIIEVKDISNIISTHQDRKKICASKSGFKMNKLTEQDENSEKVFF